jgi:hypothetical protein
MGSKLDPFKVVIDEILIADLDAPRKQRHTVTRIFDRPYDMHRGHVQAAPRQHSSLVTALVARSSGRPR